jgi:hypothetical protein
VSTAAIAGILLSRALWASASRLYPTAPLFDALPLLPPVVEYALLALLLGSLGAAAIIRRPRAAVWTAIAVLAIFVTWDQSRLQPWVYEYAALLAVLSAMAPDDSPERRGAIAATCRLILVSTYFWSGAQKANAAFVMRTWPEVAASVLAAAPTGLASMIRSLGAAVPLAECAVAIGLLTRRFRRAAVVGVVLTHATVLVFLLSSRENVVVWPWNVAMPALTIWLFWKFDGSSRDVITGAWRGAHLAFVLLFGVLPALSFFGLWDAYLSSALYSGNIVQAAVYIEPDVVPRLPPIIRENTWQRSLPMYIDLNRWSFGELEVPAYPAARVLKRIGREVCRTYGAGSVMTLRLFERPNWLTGARVSEFYRCE